MKTLKRFIPMRTVNVVNHREHWAVRNRRQKAEKAALLMFVKACDLPSLPARVTFVRLGVKLMDRGDGLPLAFKAMRDQLAKLYGVDDGDERYDWSYDQRKVKRKEVGVEIEILAA